MSRALFLCQWSGAFSLDDNRKRCIALDEKIRVLKLTDHHGACLHTGIIDIDIYNGNVALRTKRKIFSYKIQKPLLKRNLKKDA